MPPQKPLWPDDRELILDEYDLGTAYYQALWYSDPLHGYPVLANFINTRCTRMFRRLKNAGLSSEQADEACRFAREIGNVSALAMHRAIWRDLLPAPGVNGELRSRYPVDEPPDQIPPDGDLPF